MKHVLFIAYHFPPLAGGGTFRSLKFVKYLPEFGWLPTVITTNTKNYWAYDETLLQEVPKKVKIIRAEELDPFYLHIILSKIGLGKLYQKIRDRFFIPDEKIGWIPFAYRKAVKELKKEKYDLIFSTSPTPCAHIIAVKLSYRFNLPWIADYRDHWTLNPDYRYDLSRYKIENNIENQLHHKAASIIINTEGNKNDILETFKDIPSKKYTVIHNGSDTTFPIEKNNKKHNKFRMIYTGTFYGRRNPITFMKSLSQIKKDIRINEIEVNFIGNSQWDINDLSKKYEISDIVHFSPFLPIQELNNQIIESDVLLLFIDSTPNSPHVVPSKLYDYLFSNRPVLGIINDGNAKEILKKSNLGFFADPDSPEDIKNQILNLYHLWETGQLHVEPNWEYIQRFHRRNLTEQLAEMFDSIV